MRLSEPYPLRRRVRSVYGEGAWPRVGAVVREFEERGLLVVAPGGAGVHLSDPEGFLFENDVLSSILAALPDGG